MMCRLALGMRKSGKRCALRLDADAGGVCSDAGA